MATLLFKFVFLDNSSPAVTLTSVDLNSSDTPVVNISKTAFADGAVSSEVAGGALTYDAFTKSWGYRLAGADLASYLYVGMATTSYDIAAAVDVHALGMVVPDELVSSRLKPTVLNRTVNVDADGAIATVTNLTNLPATAALEATVQEILVDTSVTLPALVGAPAGASVSADIAAIAASSAAGSGAISFPVTINDEDSNPIDGVEVWVTTDSAGTNVVAGTLSTDAMGLATFMLDAGAYYLWRQKSGYNFTNPVSVTVS